MVAIPLTIPLSTMWRTKSIVLCLRCQCHVLTLALDTFVWATRRVELDSMSDGKSLSGGVLLVTKM